MTLAKRTVWWVRRREGNRFENLGGNDQGGAAPPTTRARARVGCSRGHAMSPGRVGWPVAVPAHPTNSGQLGCARIAPTKRDGSLNADNLK